MKERQFDTFFGRKLAVDASMSIYQFLVMVGRVGESTLATEAGEVTSHLSGLFFRWALGGGSTEGPWLGAALRGPSSAEGPWLGAALR
jgi:hypothetical protein